MCTRFLFPSIALLTSFQNAPRFSFSLVKHAAEKQTQRSRPTDIHYLPPTRSDTQMSGECWLRCGFFEHTCPTCADDPCLYMNNCQLLREANRIPHDDGSVDLCRSYCCATNWPLLVVAVVGGVVGLLILLLFASKGILKWRRHASDRQKRRD
jgi:hypothetical protein